MDKALVDSIKQDPSKYSLDEVFEALLTYSADKAGCDTLFRLRGLNVVFINRSTRRSIEYLTYNFSFNSDVASSLANDKIRCSEILLNSGVPCVQHHPITDVKSLSYPSVLKPRDGGGGSDIHFVYDEEGVLNALSSLSGKSICQSNYLDYSDEYRVTILDGVVLGIYGKTKGVNNQNTLSKGSKVFEPDKNIISELSDIAINATQALGLRTGNVDIASTECLNFYVMEVNSSVVFKRVVTNSPYFFEKYSDVYAECINKAFIANW